MASFIGTLGLLVGCETEPPGGLLQASVQLLMLSDGLARAQQSDDSLDGAHYLVGMGFEQTGELLARFSDIENETIQEPLDNDYWYRLLLSFLHYLAGGHRVQALSTLRHLERITAAARNPASSKTYREIQPTLRALYNGKYPEFLGNRWEASLFGDEPPYRPSVQELRVYHLAGIIRRRRDIALDELGRNDEAQWLSRRGLTNEAPDFWAGYLQQLESRGYTTFTNEQIGPEGFDAWLRPESDLLVILPTGAGKTIVGELKTALALAAGKQALWMLPTRALVRQTKRGLQAAFANLSVEVEELPTTEDFFPIFSGGLLQTRRVAATTPEKLAALLRTNPSAVGNVGLVVLDEAQILQQEGARAATAETVLTMLRSLVPDCDVVLMSAFWNSKDALGEWLERLGRMPVRLISDVRPTRRIYGVVTNATADLDNANYPSVLLYPPGIQQESGETDNPFKIELTNLNLPRSGRGNLAIATKFIREVASSRLRTVLFVNRRESTETQANIIGRHSDHSETLPRPDIARLRVELGRESAIEQNSQRGVAPHHAGLSPLEQHMVEKWVGTKIVKTVVATPTLAQGVNLPFDLSVVSFLSRYNGWTQIPLSQAEILNMLGRAGRAGHVSDGICLLALASEDLEPKQTLDSQRYIFFRPQESAGEWLGLSRLVQVCKEVPVNTLEWLMELHDLKFSEVQGLVSFSLDAAKDQENISDAIQARMKTYPSIQLIDDDTEVERTAESLAQLVDNIRLRCADDLALIEAVQKTGLPIEVLDSFMSEMRSTPDLFEMETDSLVNWADNIVFSALNICLSRQWCKDLLLQANLEAMFNGIRLWRNGAPYAEIERNWQLSTDRRVKSQEAKAKSNRIAIGKFFNHRVSLFAQFWGALAVCAEGVYGEGAYDGQSSLSRLQAFVREGVSSVNELIWLQALGGMDRVLSRRMTFTIDSLPSEREARAYVRSFVRHWPDDSGPTIIPLPLVLNAQFYSALNGAVEEQRQRRSQSEGYST